VAVALFQAALRVERTPGPIAFAAAALLLGLLARGTPGALRRWPAYESGGKGLTTIKQSSRAGVSPAWTGNQRADRQPRGRSDGY
jgi:hypothetical protein